MLEGDNNIMAVEVSAVSELQFGVGVIGNKISDHKTLIEFEKSLAYTTHTLTDTTTAFCIDGRAIESLADGTNDPEILERETYSQLPGGLAISITKSALMADASFLRDATDISHAYQITERYLSSLGYRDSAHEGCAASNSLVQSVSAQLTLDRVKQIVMEFIPESSPGLTYLEQNYRRQLDLLENGFYNSWDPLLQADTVSTKNPHLYSRLKTDDSHTHGHYESGLYIIEDATKGFSKNEFGKLSGGKQVFGFTPSIAFEVIEKMGLSSQEENRIQIAIWQDLIQVLNIVISKDAGLKIFKER